MSKIDFSISEDGDLILGAPKTDDNNNVLYYHDDGSTTIDKMKDSKEGKQIKDLTYKIGRDAYRQIIFNRLRTDAPDWYHHPSMGGNLTDLIGEPNSRETGNLGAALITNALTYNGLFAPSQVSVRAIPINAEEIMFVITLEIDNSEPYRLPITFNLGYGLKEV